MTSPTHLKLSQSRKASYSTVSSCPAINEHQDSLRQAVSTGVMNGLPIPALCNAVSYLDEFRAKAAGANLIQAQRDCFGAHTYERTDREGVFHHEWRWANDNQH